MSAKSGLFVLDSSIWIELERENPKIIKIVSPLIKNDQIVLVDLIAAEVLRGLSKESDFLALQGAFSAFPCLSASWWDVARIANRLRRSGYNPPLTDIYIAQAVAGGGATLITQDAHFKGIRAAVKFKFRLVLEPHPKR